MHSAWIKWIFVGLLKFLQTKKGGPNFWAELILHKKWIICSPGLYFNFKSLIDQNFSWFIRFHGILHDSGVLLSEFWNFYKLKRGEKISGGNDFHRKSELFGPPFCISILKVLQTQILWHSLYFNSFGMITEYFSQSFEISPNWRGATWFLGKTNFAECLNYFVPPSVL